MRNMYDEGGQKKTISGYDFLTLTFHSSVGARGELHSTDKPALK